MDAVFICKICTTEFKRSKESIRTTCSRKCAAALAWKTNPGARKKNISNAHKSPAAIARLKELNKKRWADPKEREKLSARNRAVWANPATAKKQAAAIKRAWRSPALREKMRQIRLKDWSDPAYRAKMAAGVEAYFSVPENCAAAGKRLRDRWADPIQRRKMCLAIGRFTRSEEYKAVASVRMKAVWQNEGTRDKLLGWMSDPVKLSARGKKAWETRRAKACKNSQFAKDVYALLPKLKGAAYKLTRDPNKIEDLAQIAILKAIEHEKQFTPGTNLTAWVCTILRNHFLSEKRRSWRVTELDPEYDEQRPDVNGNNAEASAELADVLSLIRALSEEQRVSLMLVAGGMSYEEASEKLDIPCGTVKSRVARARESLREGSVSKKHLPESGKALEETFAELDRALGK